MCFSWTVVRYRSPHVVLPMNWPVLLCWFRNESRERGAKLCRRPHWCPYIFLYLGCFNDARCSVFSLKLYGFACEGFAVALALTTGLSPACEASRLSYILKISKPTFTLWYTVYTIYHIFDIHILIDGRSYLTGRCQHQLDLNQMSAVYGLWKSKKALAETCLENSMCRVAASFAKMPAKRLISHTRPHISTFECYIPKLLTPTSLIIPLPNSKLKIKTLS